MKLDFGIWNVLRVCLSPILVCVRFQVGAMTALGLSKGMGAVLDALPTLQVPLPHHSRCHPQTNNPLHPNALLRQGSAHATAGLIDSQNTALPLHNFP